MVQQISLGITAMHHLIRLNKMLSVLVFGFLLSCQVAHAADRELLDILLENGVITQEQHDRLVDKESLSTEDLLPSKETADVVVVSVDEEEIVTEVSLDEEVQTAINDAVAQSVSEASPIKASYGSKGLVLLPGMASLPPTCSGGPSSATATPSVRILGRLVRSRRRAPPVLSSVACV